MAAENYLYTTSHQSASKTNSLFIHWTDQPTSPVYQRWQAKARTKDRCLHGRQLISVDLVNSWRVLCSVHWMLAQPSYTHAEHGNEPSYTPPNQPASYYDSTLYMFSASRGEQRHTSHQIMAYLPFWPQLWLGTLSLTTRNNASFSDDTRQGDLMTPFSWIPSHLLLPAPSQ